MTGRNTNHYTIADLLASTYVSVHYAQRVLPFGFAQLQCDKSAYHWPYHPHGDGKAHDERGGAHDEDRAAYDEDGGAHDEDSGAHDEDGGAHNEGGGASDEGGGAHDEHGRA